MKKEKILSVTNLESGEVTMFLKGKGGPIITGKNIEETTEKFNEALMLGRAVRDLLKMVDNKN